MQLSTRLDLDLVAVESADDITVLIDLTAPVPTATAPRAQATVQVVLDRSGSMAGDRLDSAKTALLQLVDRLEPTDCFGLVAFDDQVQVVVPTGPLTDKAAAKRAISQVQAGGSTDLSLGYLRGLQEVRRVAGPAGATVLLVSDGHANQGIVDPAHLGTVASEAQQHAVTTSSIGIGLGYDEVLLAAIAQGGAGNERFAEDADTAVGVLAGEVDGLLDQVAQAASLRVRWTEHVSFAQVLNDLPTSAMSDGFVCELGAFYAGEQRKLLLKLAIPGITALGLAQVATLELSHLSLPDLVQHSASVPVHVNVVPGDQAAGRIPDPVVRSEALFQQVQQAKKRSGRLLREGRVGEASALLRETSAGLRSYQGPLADELHLEAGALDALAEEAYIDASRASKITSMSASVSSRNRGRSNRGGLVVLRWATAHEDREDATVTLHEWEVLRLARLLPASLAAALRPSPDTVASGDVARTIAQALGTDHPLFGFFSLAAQHEGFTAVRA